METGIMIRAMIAGEWRSVDIGNDAVSTSDIVRWLRSRGGHNPWAENAFLLLLGREEIAQNMPVWAENGEAVYRDGSNYLMLAAHKTGIRVSVFSDIVRQTIDVTTGHPRVYNALIQLILGIQVHDVEKKG